MSKQQGYQSLNTGEDYGFAARLPQASGSHPTDYAHDADSKGTGTSGGAGVTYPVAYPAAAYAGAPVEGYPAMPMSTGPVGMVVQDPLGMYGRNAFAANGCRDCRRCRGCHGRRDGPVRLLFRLARSAYQSAQNHHRKRPPAPALKSTSEVLSN